MALTATTLNGAITAGQTRIRVSAFTNPATTPISYPVQALVDGEMMLVTDTTLSPSLGVARAAMGTTESSGQAVPHNTLAPVIYGLSTDFTNVNPASIAAAYVQTYSVNSTITNPTVNAVVYINKAGVCALTLTDPAIDQQNTVTFVSLTANAHTITYATGFYGNTTTSDVATFPATAGASFTIVAQGGAWRPVATADDGVTIG